MRLTCMPYCPFCGSEVSENDTFCRSCGSVLSGGTVPQRPRDDGRRTKIIALAVVGILLVSAAAGLIAVFLFDFSV